MADDVNLPNPEPVPAPTDAHDTPAVQPDAVVAVETPRPADVPTVDEPPVAAEAQHTEPAAAVAVAEPEPEPEPEAAAPPEEEVHEPAPAPKKAAPEPPPEAPPEQKKHWYVVKVQSGREDTIKEAIERRVRKEGLEEFFGTFEGALAIVIPVEKITEIKQDKNGKRVTRTKERKLYPGYLMVEVEYNDRILYLFRETSGVGDFVGAHPGHLERAPTPMSEKEVQRMLGPKAPETAGPAVPQKPKGLDVGHRVRVVDGTFNGMEGIVKQILDAVGKVQVEVSIFGRPVAVELEYYQVEEA
jgi:transcriptional antiterminator NusG